MHKLRFFFILLLSPCVLFAQQKSKVELISSTRARIDSKTNISYVKNPTFKHDNAILTCDSAVFYNDLNYFEAFKNVHINQADTMNIYSDLLNYDGNSKMAHLINNVRMIDPSSVLTTNILDYDNEDGNNPLIDLSSLKIEPWQVEQTTTQASVNTQNIYQFTRIKF